MTNQDSTQSESLDIDISKLLDGNQFASIAEHITALQSVGFYFQPKSDQIDAKLIVSAQVDFDYELGFEESCIEGIKKLIGDKLLNDAEYPAKSSGVYQQDYFRLTLEDMEEGDNPNGLRFIDEGIVQYGMIMEYDWISYPEIDPAGLEYCFRNFFKEEFDEQESQFFYDAFEKYRKDCGHPTKDEDWKLKDRDSSNAMTNLDL